MIGTREIVTLSLLTICAYAIAQQRPNSSSVEPQTSSVVEDNKFQLGKVRCRGVAATVICDVPITNTTSEDYIVLAFVKQQGGLRNTKYDKFGVSTLFDSQGGEYLAASASFGNRSTGSEGQGQFVVLADTKPTLSFRFEGVPGSIVMAKRVRLAIALKTGAGSESHEVVAKDVPIEGR